MFTHLHVHTQYSLLDGACKLDELLERTKELGMESLAITDHGVMYGVIDFYKKAKEKGIKPVIGCEVYVAPRRLYDKDAKVDTSPYHLVLLAENNIGYKNLVKLVSIASVEGFYYKPRIDLELLKEYSEGLIGLSACLSGQVSRKVLINYDEAKEIALNYRKILGENNFYLEIQNHGIDDQKIVNNLLVKMSKETGIPLVATNDVHYVKKEESIAQEILLCIQTGKTLNDEDRMNFDNDQFYLKSPEEMAETFLFAPEAIENTDKIAARCNVEFDFNSIHLPSYPVPENKQPFEYLKELCIEGINKKYGEDTKEPLEKLEYELEVIKQMGYVDYFLIVWDFIKFANDNEIMVGPGRGSAAGSVVAYALNITDIDPIKYDLIFERFLNPERVTMPDIDCDFCYQRRGEVIDYVVEKYGRDRVANIITFGTMAARGVIRDVGRAMSLPYSKVDVIAKQIPNELGMTLDKALKMNPDFKTMYDSDEQIKFLLDISKTLEGVTRHSSTHAAGVVISAKPLDELVPVQKNDDNVVTQFTMTTLEELGLLKMDFLGLRTLTVLRDCVNLIKQSTEKELNLSTIDDADENIYKNIFWNGNTEGVFQFESSGMKQFLKELQPSSIEDLIAGNSLYRPGPMDQIPVYVHNKNNPNDVVYAHEKLKSILDVTYGCMVYQEQVMAIVRELAGYSMGRADLVRRAMSKKKKHVMEEERKNFIYGITDDSGKVLVPGCIKNGVSAEIGNKLFDQMMDFASYAFNKSHAAAYSVVAYRTAYLKYYYPVEFMAALISSVMGNTDKVSEYIQACKKMNIKILPPDINSSFSDFSIDNGCIRFGFAAIKNIGNGPIEEIIRERKDKPYKNFGDFIRRVNLSEINKRCVESLIKSGVFDSLGHKRAQLMEVYENLINSEVNKIKNNIKGQISLFDEGNIEKLNIGEEYPDIPEFKNKELLQMEKEMIGIYVSGHPLDEYAEQINIKTSTNTLLIKNIKEEQEVLVAGMITSLKVIYTKNNQAMAFLNLEDMYGNLEVIIFPNSYKEAKELLKEDTIVVLKGRVSIREDEEPKLIYNSMQSIWEKLFIKVSLEGDNIDDNLKNILKLHKGDSPVYIYDASSMKSYYKLKREYWVKIDEELLKSLKYMYGEENIVAR